MFSDPDRNNNGGRGGLRAVALLLAFGLLSFFPADAHPEEVLLDEVVASVNSVAITSSQVIQETRIVLVEKEQPWAGKLPAELLESVLKRLIGKELIYQEMERIGKPRGKVEMTDGRRIRLEFERRFPSPRELQRFLVSLRISRNSLEALLLRNAKIETFMKRRLTLLSSVTDEEVERELARRKMEGKLSRDKHVDRAALLKFVRLDMEKKKYNESLKKWLNDLQERSKVFQIVRFTRDEPPVAFDKSREDAGPK